MGVAGQGFELLILIDRALGRCVESLRNSMRLDASWAPSVQELACQSGRKLQEFNSVQKHACNASSKARTPPAKTQGEFACDGSTSLLTLQQQVAIYLDQLGFQGAWCGQ